MDMQIYRDHLTVMWLLGAWDEVERTKRRIREIEPPPRRVVSINLNGPGQPATLETVEVWE